MPFDSSDHPPAARARERVTKVLQHALEEEVALSATMRECLGRIAGPNFHSLYRLFADQRTQIDRWRSEIAQRVRAFGVAARAGAEELSRSAQRFATPTDAPPARDLVGELLALHEGIAMRLREDLRRGGGDESTASLLTRLVEFHETTAWMLRMVLQRPEVPDSRA